MKVKKSKVFDRGRMRPKGSFFISYCHKGRGGRHSFPKLYPSMLVLILPTSEGWKAESTRRSISDRLYLLLTASFVYIDMT